MNRVGNPCYTFWPQPGGADRKERNFTFAQIKVDPGESCSTLLTAMINADSAAIASHYEQLVARHRCEQQAIRAAARSVARGLRIQDGRTSIAPELRLRPLAILRHPAPQDNCSLWSQVDQIGEAIDSAKNAAIAPISHTSSPEKPCPRRTSTSAGPTYVTSRNLQREVEHCLLPRRDFALP